VKSPKYLDNNIMERISQFANQKTKGKMIMASKNLYNLIKNPKDRIEKTNNDFFMKALELSGKKRKFQNFKAKKNLYYWKKKKIFFHFIAF